MGGQPATFLVDTGAQHSVLTRQPGPLSEKTAWVQGATGRKSYQWTTERKVHLANDEKQGYAKGVLTQKLGPWRRPVAYLSKKLDPVAAGWPPCLKMVAAIALLLKDSMKLTLGQPVMVFAPHAVESLVKQPPGRWLSNARMTHYQTLLLDSERITYGSPVVLNPASLLPLPGEPDPHDCIQILAEVHGTRPDLTDQPLSSPDYTWFTDESSFVHNGLRKAGAAVTTTSEVIWAETLPPGTSAQRTELIALAQALRMAEALSIIQTPGHQKGDNIETRGNRLADQAAREAAVRESAEALPVRADPEDEPPLAITYSQEDLELIKKMGAAYDPISRLWVHQGKPIWPTQQTKALI